MRIAFVFGTRPEVIKLAPVIHEARRRGHDARIILTGQHRELALPLLEFFGLKPDLDLDVMTPNQSLPELSARVLARLDAAPDWARADWVAVQGDTTSAFVAAFWGFCRGIRVAHVEAGLRTGDLRAPFPEEANRQLIGRIATLHLAPTARARLSLRRENVADRSIRVVGNTAIDALLWALREGRSRGVRLPAHLADFIGKRRLVLVTSHRRESFGAGFEKICEGIRALADARENIAVVYPVHPNPNVRAPVEKGLGGHPRILLCEPLAYPEFVAAMKQADLLLTDSGGIQEEGPTLKKPIVVLREKTERPEGVRAGFAKLVGTDPRKIRAASLAGLDRGCRGRGRNPYGDGRSAARIVRALERSQ